MSRVPSVVTNSSRPFASHLNFLDPQTTKDGEDYGPIRYEELVKECYVISKNLHISYSDVLNMTPIERSLLISFMREDMERQKQEIERRKAEREANKPTYNR